MSGYFINIFLVLCIGFSSFAQNDIKSIEELEKETPKDSVSYKTAYGFRLGADISKPIISFLDDTYSGLELVADYRIKKNWYIATELGYEEKIVEEDFTTSTSSGTYFRLGANLNLYKNWLDMNNEVYVGVRYGFSIFEQELNDFTPNVTDATFTDYFGTTTISPDISCLLYTSDAADD